MTKPKYPRWAFFSERPSTPYHAYRDRSSRTVCGQVREPIGCMWLEKDVRAHHKPLCEHCLAILKNSDKLVS